jgi:hypothetical protein
MNNGDDCVVFMERADMEQFMKDLPQWFLKMGFRMTVEEPVYEMSKIEFCQMRPIETVNGWTMVRNIDKAREKDSMSIIPLTSSSVARKWMYAVGECGLALCGGVPIMQAMYESYMRSGIKSKLGQSVAMQTGAKLLARGLESKSARISDKARLDVFIAWGITPDEQCAMETWYDELEFDLTTERAIDNLEEVYPCPL